jgi:hypothetical protein
MSNEAHARADEPAVSGDEYEAFYAVLSATARGRAFLNEHARRQRHSETEVLLAALKRLENQVARQSSAVAANQPMFAEVAAVIETVRNARAEIDAVRLSGALTQLVNALDTVQSRLSALVAPAAPASMKVESPAPSSKAEMLPAPPFPLAIAAVAAQALADETGEEPIKVLKAGSIPPPPPFTGDDFSFGDDTPAQTAAERASDGIEIAIAGVPMSDSAEDAFAPIMALSEEERLALFS